MLGKSFVFQPQVIIIALYTGNDARETLRTVYSIDRFKRFRHPSLSLESFAAEINDDAEKDSWEVSISDHNRTIFTPLRRLLSNRRLDKGVQEGYSIMHRILKEMNSVMQSRAIKLFITVFPTKEFVYGEMAGELSLNPPQEYTQLLLDEGDNIKELVTVIKSQSNLHYIDLIGFLRSVVRTDQDLYPPDQDGHPMPKGYDGIGRFLASQVAEFIAQPISGAVEVEISTEKRIYLLLREKQSWIFDSFDLVLANGWSKESVKRVAHRAVADIPIVGRINAINPALYGPAASDN